MKKEKRTTILRFYSFTKGLRHNFVLALLTMAISVFAGYMTPQIIRVTVDSVINDSPFNLPSFLATQIENMGGRDFLRQNLILCALASLLFAVLAGISTYLSRMNMAKGCEGTVTKIRNTLFSHIQRLPYAWHNKNQTGDIIQRCTQDVDLIHNFINDQMMELVRVVFLIVVSLALMFSMNAKLALIAFIFIPIVVGYSMIFFVIVGDRFRIADEAEGKLTAMVQENLTGVRVVRAFGRERFEKDKFNKQNDLFSDLWVRLGHVMGVNWGIGDLLSGIQVLTIIAAGIVFVVDGAITEGEYLAFVAYNSMLVWPTRSLGRLLSELSKTGISSKRIFEILDAEPEKDAETPVTPPMDRDIVFKHVNFSYGTSGEVLHDIDLKIPAGTTLGILGSTGSGKSTLTYLLDRLYELPYFLMGHSMGSFIAREFAAAYGNSLTAVVFMGTSAGISTAMWKAERAYLNMLKKAKGARAKIPSLEKIATGPYNKKFKPNRTNYDWVTSKEEEVDRFVNDPLCGFPLTVQGYIDLGTLLYAINTDQWYRRVPKDLPILLISGENDPVGDMGKGVRRVFDKLNKTGHDVKLTLYPRIRHALITEMNSAQVYEDLYAFFSSHLPKAKEPVSEKETEAEAKVSTETEKSVENPAAEEEKETEAAAAEKNDDMPEENAELPVI